MVSLKDGKSKGKDIPKHCDVAIVGGGIGGLFMAESLLRHKKETDVCVFERHSRLGGRLYDYVFPQVPDVYVGELFKEREDIPRGNPSNLTIVRLRLESC